ncbi:transporter [Lactococcus raffinolactis]|uniref:lipopolysaccharide biosynthesis protein n=1 Tax=Pseudolactococcus raffinolactis TaxID=1366 RepID=UPI001C7013C7|nr:transporter [Lactococcus raffinolactis]MBW9330371.1 transporter [Lactococcus raffinolactis]
MSDTNSQKALKNIIISFGTQMILLVFKFVVQTSFIVNLGQLYIGTNSLLTNVFTVFSFAELGLGTAIAFNLYRPIAEGNQAKISAYMRFYKHAYEIIGVVVAVSGLAFMPFIQTLIKGEVVNHLPIIYLLFLLNIVTSYFFTYKRTLLTAFQEEYKNQLNIFWFTVIQMTLQSVVLILFKDFILYLVIQVICTFLSNFMISRLVDKEHPYLKNYQDERITKVEFNIIKRNVLELLGSKVGGIVLTSTDNILISKFIGLIAVGQYANYLLITSSITFVVNKTISSVIASIGNMSIKNSKFENMKAFYQAYFLNYLAAIAISSGLLTLLTPFIYAWAGASYTMGFWVLLFTVLNYLIGQMRQTINAFMFAYGALQYQGIKSIIEAASNLIISIILVTQTNLGVAGILLGTLLTNILINSWFEAFQVFRLGFKHPVKQFLIYNWRHLIVATSFILVIYYLVSFIELNNIWLTVAARGVTTLLLDILVVALHAKSPYFDIIKKVIVKSNNKM